MTALPPHRMTTAPAMPHPAARGATRQPRPPAWDCHVHVFDTSAAVLPGHYQPPHHPLAQIEAHAGAAGVGHLVLVQPSVYGTDNHLLLQALQAGAGRHRGVAVVAPEVPDATLAQLHAAGVRGVRFNLVSPVGAPRDPAAQLRQLAPRLRALGWHVQWYVRPADLPALLALQAQTGLVFVLDHLAGINANTPPDDPAWHTLAALADTGAWVKLSGWYRLQAEAPFTAIHPTLQRVARCFAQHTVWGSDWPHTSLANTTSLPYAATWQPVHDGLGAATANAVRLDHPRRLYA